MLISNGTPSVGAGDPASATGVSTPLHRKLEAPTGVQGAEGGVQPPQGPRAAERDWTSSLAAQ